MLSNIPFAGVGVAWIDNDDYRNHVVSCLDPNFTYFEVHLPSHPPKLPVGYKCVAHCSTLGLADIRSPERQLVQDVLRQSISNESLWIGDHIAVLGTTTGVQFGYIFPPVIDQSTYKRVVTRVNEYQSMFKIPFLLELGPRYSKVGQGTGLEDFELLKSVSVETGAPIILDIPHSLSIAHEHRISFDDIVNTLRSARVMEVHVGADGIGLKRKEHEMWRLVLKCLDTFPDIKGVTIELGRQTSIGHYIEEVSEFSDLLLSVI